MPETGFPRTVRLNIFPPPMKEGLCSTVVYTTLAEGYTGLILRQLGCNKL
jgi:hypothetical protein